MIASPADTSVLRLGAWNIKKLGHGFAKDFGRVGQIIESNFDIMAVVEVMEKGGGHPGYDALIVALGTGWAGIVTAEPRPNTTSGSAEFYAIVYRPDVVSPCTDSNTLVFHDDNDGSGSNTGEDHFSREPAFGCFVVPLADGSVAFDFILAPYHARFAEGDIDDISAEVEHVDEVFESMATVRSGERDLIIAGDFNLVPSDLEQTLSREISTLGTGSTLNGSGERAENLYDHLVLFDSAATGEIIGTAEVIA